MTLKLTSHELPILANEIILMQNEKTLFYCVVAIFAGIIYKLLMRVYYVLPKEKKDRPRTR